MPLTPADVHNVAFSKPPIGKRGYYEVDASRPGGKRADPPDRRELRSASEINELDQELPPGVTPQANGNPGVGESEPGARCRRRFPRDERTGPEGGASAESGPRHRRPAYKHRQSRVGQDAGRCLCQSRSSVRLTLLPTVADCQRADAMLADAQSPIRNLAPGAGEGRCP